MTQFCVRKSFVPQSSGPATRTETVRTGHMRTRSMPWRDLKAPNSNFWDWFDWSRTSTTGLGRGVVFAVHRPWQRRQTWGGRGHSQRDATTPRRVSGKHEESPNPTILGLKRKERRCRTSRSGGHKTWENKKMEYISGKKTQPLLD